MAEQNNEQGKPNGNEGGQDQTKDQSPNNPQGNADPTKHYNGDPSLDINGNPIEGYVPPKDKAEDDQQKDGDQTDDKGGDADKGEDNKDTKVDFDTSAAKQVEGLLKEAGLNPQDVARSINAEGGQITPAIYKAIAEKHGEGVAELVKGQLSNFHNQAKQIQETQQNAVFDSVKEHFKDVTQQSGADTWKELQGWAKDNIPSKERNELNKLLEQGGVATELAIDRIVSKFKSSKDFVQPAQLETGGGYAQSKVDVINRTQYVQELNKLLEAGHDYNTSPEIARLNSRREASRKRGV